MNSESPMTKETADLLRRISHLPHVREQLRQSRRQFQILFARQCFSWVWIVIRAMPRAVWRGILAGMRSFYDGITNPGWVEITVLIFGFIVFPSIIAYGDPDPPAAAIRSLCISTIALLSAFVVLPAIAVPVGFVIASAYQQYRFWKEARSKHRYLVALLFGKDRVV